jgi:hypothetical protein
MRDTPNQSTHPLNRPSMQHAHITRLIVVLVVEGDGLRCDASLEKAPRKLSENRMEDPVVGREVGLVELAVSMLSVKSFIPFTPTHALKAPAANSSYSPLRFTQASSLNFNVHTLKVLCCHKGCGDMPSRGGRASGRTSRRQSLQACWHGTK